MPEELKPCPACGSLLLIKRGLGVESHTNRLPHIECYVCGVGGPHCSTIEEAVAEWNAFARALEWTNEPKLGAWNWWGNEEERIPRYVYQDGTVAIAMQIDRVPYQVLGGHWCPIPEPREPK